MAAPAPIRVTKAHRLGRLHEQLAEAEPDLAALLRVEGTADGEAVLSFAGPVPVPPQAPEVPAPPEDPAPPPPLQAPDKYASPADFADALERRIRDEAEYQDARRRHEAELVAYGQRIAALGDLEALRAARQARYAQEQQVYAAAVARFEVLRPRIQQVVDAHDPDAPAPVRPGSPEARRQEYAAATPERKLGMLAAALGLAEP